MDKYLLYQIHSYNLATVNFTLMCSDVLCGSIRCTNVPSNTIPTVNLGIRFSSRTCLSSGETEQLVLVHLSQDMCVLVYLNSFAVHFV